MEQSPPVKLTLPVDDVRVFVILAYFRTFPETPKMLFHKQYYDSKNKLPINNSIVR